MLIIAIIALALLFIGISFYNSLISKKNQVTNAFSAIDVMLKKRHDLLPNLVEVVQQYAKHEKELLSTLTSLRGEAIKPVLTETEKIAADQQISDAVKGLMVNVENYPDLKANQNFLHLQRNWAESEEQVAAARRNYNSSVTSYNNALLMFPGNLFASTLGYRPVPVLETSPEERKNPNAKELFNR